MKIFNKNALTFVELIISVVITAIIFMMLYFYISNSINTINISNDKTDVVSQYYEVYNDLAEIKLKYNSWELILDNNIWSWSDVLLLNNLDNTEWILFWIIDKKTSLLVLWNSHEIYGEKVFWYKKLSLSEISKIKSQVWDLQNISFRNSKMYDSVLKDFQASFYNSWSILSLTFDFLAWYNKNYEWKKRKDINKNNYIEKKVNFNF